MGNVITCRNCNGSGKVTVYKTDKDGKNVPVQQDCGQCRGSGVIPG